MKRATYNKLIEFFALCGVIAFGCGFADIWAFVACAIFGGIAGTICILRELAID